jgi:radical SAM protein with 4Fe4S-binding SPASM domain
MSNTKVYCTAPWNGITVRENGDVKTCCVGGAAIGNLNQESIHDILKSEKLLNIQKNMLNGQPDVENCQNCLKAEENSGLATLRQHYLRYYPDIVPGEVIFNSLDIRWNNTCNLGCLYCTPTFSSTWANKLNMVNSGPVKSYHEELLDFILAHSNSVQEIMLVGGEPMLMKQNYRLFEKLPPTTRISILTNLSYDLESLPCVEDLLARPKENIVWNISVENTNKQFEYVRNGGDWNQLEKNINFLYRHWDQEVTVNMVYCMFSAFELPQTIEKFHSLGIKKFNLQSYFGDPHLDVFKMPRAIQKLALDSLQEAENVHLTKIHKEDQQLFSMSNIDFLKNTLGVPTKSNSLTKQGFLNKIDWYDQWTDHKFHDLWPHVIQMVNKHLA